MLVYFRKRLSMDIVCKINEQINQKAFEEAPSEDDDDLPNSGSSGNESQNRGKLLVDATCTPADITFPTDLKILNKAREKSEDIIDALHRPCKGIMKKPRTYRIKARRDFLAIAKSKNVSKNKMRKAIRKQIGYLRRNLKTIAKLTKKSSLLLLSKRQYRNLLVIHEVYRQQRWCTTITRTGLMIVLSVSLNLMLGRLNGAKQERLPSSERKFLQVWLMDTPF
jgi:transposase, IS5 family